MKLDFNILRYLGREEIRVLTAVEMGMKNHEIVPTKLIESIAKIRRGGTFKIVQQLLKYKLIQHDSKQYDGYFLTYQGYDALAIYSFLKRGLLSSVKGMLGTGKESDIYLCLDQDGNDCVVKLARLGRISFRAVKSKRDYLKNRSKNNWLYLSRLAAIREYSFMEALFAEGVPTPSPISHNRHAILMSRVNGFPLINIRNIENPTSLLNKIINLGIRLVQLGLVHSDFNQFNLMVTEEGEVIVIDFPQMVSVNHPHAEEFWIRDLECLNKFFLNRFEVECSEFPEFKEIEVFKQLDEEVQATGYMRAQLTQKEIQDLEELNQVNRSSDSQDEGEPSEDNLEETEELQEPQESQELQGEESPEASTDHLKKRVNKQLQNKNKPKPKHKNRNKNKISTKHLY